MNTLFLLILVVGGTLAGALILGHSSAGRHLTANAECAPGPTENPEVLLENLRREMDGSIAELRRQTVDAVARQKQLEKRVAAAEQSATELEGQAVQALAQDDERLARQFLARRVDVLDSHETLNEELASAAKFARRLESDFLQMQNQVGVARRSMDELIRRKRAAEAQLRIQEAARRSIDAMDIVAGKTDGDGYADAIGEMEARAKATREVSSFADGGDPTLFERVAASEIDAELDRLKKQAS